MDFSANRMVHFNAMILWMLYGLIGCTYWLLEDESCTKIACLKHGVIGYSVLTAAIAAVVLVYLFIPTGADFMADHHFVRPHLYKSKMTTYLVPERKL